jgi:hypothetical protein
VERLSKCKTVQDENKIERITVKTREGQHDVPKLTLSKSKSVVARSPK